MKFRWKALRSSACAAVVLGPTLAIASTLAANPPAGATSSGDQWLVRGLSIGVPGLRIGALASGVPTPASQLLGVFCTSPANCWAVGDTSNGDVERNQVLHWTGRHWFGVKVPNPGGMASGDSSQLFAVRCTSASNCWAVGNARTGDQGGVDQALHWNGKKWLVVDTPTPGGILTGDINTLSDVTCTSARNCVAVGFYGANTSTMTGESELLLNQVLRWNGVRWSLASAPNPAGVAQNHVNVLAAVRCASSGDCWAAGTSGHINSKGQPTLRNEMLHWNGRKWLTAPVPSPGGAAPGAFNELNALACASAVNCWAAGFAGQITSDPSTSELLNVILRFNGRKWLKQTVPNPGGGSEAENGLFGITCSSARNCWAVGSSGTTASQATLNEAFRWNGTKWSSFKTPNPSGMGGRNVLNAARCTSVANCWAVGLSQKSTASEENEILHWTGKKWFAG